MAWVEQGDSDCRERKKKKIPGLRYGYKVYILTYVSHKLALLIPCLSILLSRVELYEIQHLVY